LERLQKILSEYGICSRREAEKMIAAGRVRVDGTLAAVGDKADPVKNVITVDGERLAKKEKRVCIVLNKPRGYLSSVSDDRGRKTVIDLVSECNARVYPVGRLDLNSDGLLLLSNDGEFTKRLTHPSFQVPKHYRIRIRGGNPDEIAKSLSEPMTVKGVRYSGAEVSVLERGESDGTALLSLTLREGKNREIRNMCEALGVQVARLTRVGVGNLRLGGLKSGEWRYLTDNEINGLTTL
jgi:23S rRNA pseudouridine2605 synthase